MKRLIAFLTGLLLCSLAVASAQSLAEIAKKEKERRENNERPDVKSFNDNDLTGFRGDTLSGSLQAADVTQEPDDPSEMEEGEVEEEEDPTQTEAYWRNRLAPLDRRITDVQAQLNQPGFAEDPSNMLRRGRLERELEQAQRERAAIEQEARRKGVPPGWLR